MSHILIQNQGELPIWGLRLLGLSNKDESQIGQFGTGLKESIALLARLDALPVIYSGTCRMDFAIRTSCSQDEIHFRLSSPQDTFLANTWYGLGMHPDFGKADWDDPWMVFREVICNALDEGPVSNLVHDVTSSAPSGVAGSTRFYIPMTPPLLAAYGTVHEKLLPLSEPDYLPISGFPEDTVLKKRAQPTLQIFHRGVWVQESQKETSLYDYNISKLRLNESRSCDWHDIHTNVAKILCAYTQEMAANLLDRAIRHKEEFFELETAHLLHIWLNVSNGANWRNAFYSLFGENAVITDNDKFYYDRISQRGRRPVIILDSGLRVALKNIGIPTASEFLSSQQKEYEKVQDPTPEAQAVFDSTWDAFLHHSLTRDRPKPSLMQFLPRPGLSTITSGSYSDGTCYLNKETAGTVHERSACIEEIAHHITGASDETREFQTFLVECLERTMPAETPTT